MNKERLLNIELLRIISMLLIILWHVQCHILYPLHLQSHHFLNYVFSFIPFHVDLFVLITGFFGVRNSTKGIVRTMTLLWFYSILINGILFFTGIGQYSFKEALLPLSHSEWWFMQHYFVLLLVAPVVETFISKCSDKSYSLLVLSILFVNIYMGFFNQVPGLNNGGYDIINFLCMYVLGTWIRKQGIKILSNKRYLRFKLFVIVIILIAFKYKVDGWMWIDISFSEYNSPYCILMAMCVFLIFQRTNISKSLRGIIMFFSSSVVAAYLITDHHVIRSVLSEYFVKKYILHQSDYIGVFYILLCVILSFIACCCFDKLRLRLTSVLDSRIIACFESKEWLDVK